MRPAPRPLRTASQRIVQPRSGLFLGVMAVLFLIAVVIVAILVTH